MLLKQVDNFYYSQITTHKYGLFFCLLHVKLLFTILADRHVGKVSYKIAIVRLFFNNNVCFLQNMARD